MKFKEDSTASFILHPATFVGLAIIFITIVLSFLFLGEKSIWLDEAFSIQIAKSEWKVVWQHIAQYDVNMGSYNVLLHLWMYLGESESHVRSLSAIFAVLTVPATYKLGSLLFSQRVGALAALLMAVNAYFIRYAQEARGYSLLLLLVTLSSLCFVTVINRPTKRGWGVYVVISALAFYTHLFAGLIIVAQGASLLFLRRQDIPWKALLMVYFSIAILILPIGLFLLTSDTSNINWIKPVAVRNVFGLFKCLAGDGGMILLVLYFLPGLISLIAAVKKWKAFGLSFEVWRYALLMTWLFLPIAIIFGLSLFKPMFVYRYFLICLPPLIVLVAVGFSQIRIKWAGVVCLGLVLIFSGRALYKWYMDFEKEDWRRASTYVLSKTEAGDSIIFFSPDTSSAFRYYQDRYETKNLPILPYYDADQYEEIIPVYDIPREFGVGGGRLPDLDAALSNRLAAYSRVWLVLSHDYISSLGRDMQSQAIEGVLEDRFGSPDETEFSEIKVLLFSNEG